MKIRTKSLYKSFIINNKKINIINNLNFQAEDGITIILGKSGCGKTTLLRILAGLEVADRGDVIIENNNKVSIVFQEARLMPWLNVFQNIHFGHKNIDNEKIQNLIEITSLKGFEKAYPNQLSIGMMQRVAIARALYNNGDIILMDEPFASLDYFNREILQRETINIYLKNKKSIIFVTHSIDEALLLGHKIIILEKGEIKKEYLIEKDIENRDILTEYFIELKKDILKQIKN